MTEHQDDEETAEPSEDEEDVERNLPGTPDENAEGLVDGVAEGE